MTSITCHYNGGLRCRAEHGPSGSSLETDAPPDNQGQGTCFSPTDLIATSLATCLLTVMGIVAERHGWVLEGASARVEKRMSSGLPRRIAELEVWLTLPEGLDAQQQATLRRAAETCPVKTSLDGAVPITLHWDGAGSGVET
jgi:putative redox protein